MSQPGRVLARAVSRACKVRLNGKIEIYFKDGVLQDHFKIESTVRGASRSDEELDLALEVAMPATDE